MSVAGDRGLCAAALLFARAIRISFYFVFERELIFCPGNSLIWRHSSYHATLIVVEIIASA